MKANLSLTIVKLTGIQNGEKTVGLTESIHRLLHLSEETNTS